MVTELFTRSTKLNISLVFIIQSYFPVPKNISLNSAHYLIMNILNKRDIEQIEFNHSFHIGYEEFINFFKKCTMNPYSFLVNDTTLASYSSLRLKKNLLEKI